MPHTLAPAGTALRAQATARAPQRNRLKDGQVGDLAHRTRQSWHNPTVRRQTREPEFTPDGIVLAVDLTHDPANGCDAHALALDVVARRDPRVWEVISQGRIWTWLRAAEGWRTYSGPNPHDEHIHLSLTYTARDDVSPWWPAPATEKDDDMTEDQSRMLREVHAMLKAMGAPRAPAKIDPDKDRISLGDVLTLMERRP